MRSTLCTWLLCAAMVAAATPPHTAGAATPAPGAGKSSADPKMPKAHEYSYSYDLIDNTVVRPATRFFDVALMTRKLTHNPREAENVDENDQVRLPSTWWQPRIGFRTVTVDQMRTGPGPGTGPAAGHWTVTKAKSQGVSSGFQIEDAKGEKFLVKFDPPNSPELATGTDVIGSYLFWAAGYNVPENAIAYFRPGDLEISKKATYTDNRGVKHPVTRQYLNDLLSRVARQPDGRYRCLASKMLPGKPLGPFHYNGRRKDDPEDLIPHEHRRELRGLWTVAAWLNHADSRGPNSLDMWVTDGGRSFVRHNLIDFGSILGSSAMTIKRDYATGWEYYVDYGAVVRNTTTLGLRQAKWEHVVDPEIPAVGFVESKVFDGDDWRPDLQNPAFDERTERDIRWGARIVAGFTNEYIEAAVAAAHYSDPRAAEYLTNILIERRDKLVARWLGPQAPALATSK